jgi:hypothetical protein
MDRFSVCLTIDYYDVYGWLIYKVAGERNGWGYEMMTSRDECKQPAENSLSHVEVIHFMLPIFLGPIRSIVIIRRSMDI